MSAQPPHHRVTGFYASALHHSRIVIAAVCVILAGCATQNESYKLADSDEFDHPGMLVGNRSARNQYLGNVRSDPLGAYLASHDQVNRPHTRSLASTALNYLGIKYRFGGDTPNQGFDCSGLVRYAAEKSLGLKLPRQSKEMARLGESINKTELKSGDLVFFNTRGHRFSHVGIYVGDGKFVHAPSSGSKVRIEDMEIAYWKKRYNGARRLASNMPLSAAAATALGESASDSSSEGTVAKTRNPQMAATQPRTLGATSRAKSQATGSKAGKQRATSKPGTQARASKAGAPAPASRRGTPTSAPRPHAQAAASKSGTQMAAARTGTQAAGSRSRQPAAGKPSGNAQKK